VLAPSAMGEFLYRFIAELELGTPHLVAPDVGASAALFLAARHPGTLRSLLVGGGGAAYPLDVTGTLADIIAAPGIEVFEGQDIRATIGASVEPVAPRDREPDVWEDYVSAYENGRFAQSTRYVRSYPDQLSVLRDLLPAIRVPVHVFAAIVADWVARAEAAQDHLSRNDLSGTPQNWLPVSGQSRMPALRSPGAAGRVPRRRAVRRPRTRQRRDKARARLRLSHRRRGFLPRATAE